MRRRDVVVLHACPECGERECEARDEEQCRAWTAFAEQRSRIESAAGRGAWRDRHAHGSRS